MLNSETRESFKTYLLNGQIITGEIFDHVLVQEIERKNQQIKNYEIQRQLDVLGEN